MHQEGPSRQTESSSFSSEVEVLEDPTMQAAGAGGSSSDDFSTEEAGAASIYPRTLNREQKVDIMKRALSLELGGFQEVDIFNTFYSEDLIVFGMQNNIPEAIRLGERTLAESGGSLPAELAWAVK